MPSTIALCLALPLAVLATQAQDAPPEPPPRQDDVRLRPAGAGSQEGVLPGFDLPDPRPATARELPEGTFLNEAQGIVVELTTGGWAFVFDADTSGVTDPPMVLQPSMQTAAMLRLVGARDDTVTFRVAGEVQRYLGRHYLLPLRFDVIAPEADPGEPTPEERAEEAERRLQHTGEESADDLAARVAQAEKDRERNGVPSAIGTGAEAGEEGGAALLSEGSMVIDLAGRLERDVTGLWVFTSDNDADASNELRVEGPIILVPCLMLEALERDLQRANPRAALTISGRALVFEGENFLLPTLYRLRPDVGGNLTTAQ